MQSAMEFISSLLADDSVTEIMVDGMERVYMERKGRLEDLPARFESEQEIIDWANSLLNACGSVPVSAAHPCVEARLPDGSYLVVVIPPVSIRGPSLTLSKPMPALLTFEEIIRYGSLSAPMLEFFRLVMRAQLNILVAGGTASGKTTLTRMLADLIPEDERLVVVGQDFMLGILRPKHRHLVCLETVAASAAAGAPPSASELLLLASHMRPDRIITGEFCGAEVKQAIHLMNNGHTGMLSTLHANSARDALFRLEVLMTLAEPGVPLPAIRTQIADALDLLVYAARLEDGSRKVLHVAQVQGMKGDHILLQDVFTWERTGMSEDGRLLGEFRAAQTAPVFDPTKFTLQFPAGMFSAPG